MSHLFFIRFKAAFVAAAFILAMPVVGLAGEKIKDLSPDGQFAMSLEDGGDGEVQISLVEANSHKFLLKLDDSGHPYQRRAHTVDAGFQALCFSVSRSTRRSHFYLHPQRWRFRRS